MNKDLFAKRVLSQLELWSDSDDATNDMGTRLIGHAPDIAPKAYVHVVYAPLDESELQELCARLERPVPTQFKEFLTCANGLLIFLDEIRVMGYVPLKRRGDTSIHNYPPSLMVPNVSARLKGLSDGAVAIGFYQIDGSYVAIEKSGLVVRFDAKGDAGAIQKWPDFDTWLISEISRLSEGKKKAATIH